MKLRARIGNDAFWVPPKLWSIAAEQLPDGCFEGLSAQELAMLLEYSGDAPSMLQALLEAGFMDANPLRVHDWEEHNGYHVSYAERARSAAKARWEKVNQRKAEAQKRKEAKEKEDTEKRREEPSNAKAMLGASVDSFGLEFPQNLRTPAFAEKWKAWTTYRQTRAKVKDWVSLFQEQLTWLGTFPEPTAVSMLSTSLRNGWQGIFETKDTKPNGQKAKPEFVPGTGNL